MEGDNVIIIHAHIGKVKKFRSIVKSCFFRKDRGQAKCLVFQVKVHPPGTLALPFVDLRRR